MAELIRRALQIRSGAATFVGRSSSIALQKRVFDLIVAVSIALISFPVMLCIACYVKSVSRGPVIFSQKRTGRGFDFTIYKFRTMHPNAKGPLDQIRPHDDRIIPGGRFLRSTHLDELPQLWNVLMGHMSIVGPRPRPPEVDAEWAQVVPYYFERQKVRPGITGPAQLLGRSESVREKWRTSRLERDYIQNWSLRADVAILIRTIPHMLLRKGV